MSRTTKGTVGATRRSEAQGRELVTQWRQSGQTVTAFCRKRSVGPHVLRYWVSREEAPHDAAKRSEFVVMAAPAESSAESGGAESIMQNAVLVVLPATTPARLAQTVRALLQETGA